MYKIDFSLHNAVSANSTRCPPFYVLCADARQEFFGACSFIVEFLAKIFLMLTIDRRAWLTLSIRSPLDCRT